ncbi:glucose PTS transporter subunit IIA [Marinicrinis lubricantis]|uniref:Glucose PTS transporter subunit IIA n=1 Tax=Marinicrinis lubricantis TaxID=2086470 RepID=A0ABW1IQH0_9BACL
MNWMGNLQQFGRSLMLPMIALPAAAILMRLGNVQWPEGMTNFGEVLTLAGSSIFLFLPYIFAVCVALGLTDNAAPAGMSALWSYYVFVQVTTYLTDHKLHIGVTGGIIIGVISAIAYHRFKDMKLPEYIQFFGGPRFVPIFMSAAAILFSYIMVFLQSSIEIGLKHYSNSILELGGFGAFIYGVLHRLLVPSGLHHILNNFAWFQFGAYETEDGNTVFGDIPRFFAQDPEAGMFMAGLYPIMMFALPAIAFAIIREAREDLKPRVKATFMTAALTAFLTGVTEPIEFAFLFVAPYLFLVHALLSGLAMWITYALDIHHGFSFSAGAIDFMLNAYLSKNALLIIPIGVIYAIVYYFMFRWAIRKFDIQTPGREDGSPLDEGVGDIPYRAPLVLQALGGKSNIVKLEACITRLRLTLDNDRKMDMTALRHLGAVGVIRLGGGNVQVVFGTFSELIREEMMKIMHRNLEHIHFHSPLQGRMIPLEEVPDPIFSAKLVGEGVAFLPDRGELVSPVSGLIKHVHPSKHAVGIETEEGLEVLLHIGIDTSSLNGQYFDVHVKEGDHVEQGELLVRFNVAQLKKHAKSLATPMVITNPDKVKSWNFAPFKAVKKGQASVMSVIMKEEQPDGGKAS